MAWSLYKNKGAITPDVLYYYNFDGLTQAGETNRHIIPDATVDDFSVEFTLYAPVDTGSSIVLAQNTLAAPQNSDFRIEHRGGSSFQFVVGGTETTTSTVLTAAKWRLDIVGTTYTIFKDNVQVETNSFTRGVATEPLSTLVVGARHNGTNDSYGFFYEGGISDVRVSPIAPTVFDEANFLMDTITENPVDSFGGGDMALIQYDANNWLERP